MRTLQQWTTQSWGQQWLAHCWNQCCAPAQTTASLHICLWQGLSPELWRLCTVEVLGNSSLSFTLPSPNTFTQQLPEVDVETIHMACCLLGVTLSSVLNCFPAFPQPVEFQLLPMSWLDSVTLICNCCFPASFRFSADTFCTSKINYLHMNTCIMAYLFWTQVVIKVHNQ